MSANATGKISQVIGAVVDVEWSRRGPGAIDVDASGALSENRPYTV